MQEAGIRAFVGKLSMDISSRPTYVEKSAQDALTSASSFVKRCRNLVSHLPSHRRLIEPVLTPRFVPTCSDELLSGLGQISETESLRIQSHLAESHDQVEWVRSERGVEDIEVFDKVCPLDIMDAMRQAVAVSRMREGRNIMSQPGSPGDPHASEENLAIDWKESLYLATRGGSIALGLKEGSGMFTIGAPFDAQHIHIYDTSVCAGVCGLDFFDVSLSQDGRLRLKPDMIEKWWCTGDVRNRLGTWVQGIQVSL
ncbi:hypothetical protein BDQ17DRAFT_1353098 [Cyathus striatus]|nr:hypothetical protein BDQ17DRAFT_1353098 [Cyathus striatus]